MKLSPPVVVLLFSVLTSTALLAIPQNVGGFINAQNNLRQLTLEEWFRDASHWESTAGLPGTWIMGTVPTGRMMRQPGAVFGVEAESVVVNTDEKGAVKNVQVFYDAATAKVPKGDLLKRLQKAVALFTGADGRAAGYQVALAAPNAGAVTATFTR